MAMSATHQGRGGVVGASQLHQPLGHRPPIIFSPNPVLCGDDHVIEENLVEFMLPGQVEDWRNREPGAVHVDQQES